VWKIARAAEPRLDRKQFPEQRGRAELGLDLGDRVDEFGLIRIADGRAAVERGGAHQPGGGNPAELTQRAPQLSLGLAEVGTESDERPNRRHVRPARDREAERPASCAAGGAGSWLRPRPAPSASRCARRRPHAGISPTTARAPRALRRWPRAGPENRSRRGT